MRGWLVRHGWGVWIGFGLTALAVILHALGVFERFELAGYDINVQRFSRVAASPHILHVDIDDAALDRVGSWPWPRDLQGDLIAALRELGARRIGVDLLWSEARPPEVRIPGLERYAELTGEKPELGTLSDENVVYPDRALAASIAQAYPVFLSMYDAQAESESVAAAYRPNAQTGEGPSDERQIASLVRRTFGMTAEQIADELNLPPRRVSDVLAGIKRRIAREQVSKILATQPAAGVQQVHECLLTTPFERPTADRADVLAAFEREKNLRAFWEKCPPLPSALKGRIPRLTELNPPIESLTRVAAGVGFVTFRPDADGRTRRVPLVMEWNDRLIPQLGFAVACDELEIRPEDLRIEGDRLVIAGQGSRARMSVQLDPGGQMLINWHVQPRWEKCFTHLPATQVLSLVEAEKSLHENAHRRELMLLEAFRVGNPDAAPAYERDLARLLELQRIAASRPASPSPSSAPAEREVVEKRLASQQRETIAFIRENWDAVRGDLTAADPAAAQEAKRFQRAVEWIERASEVDRINARIAARRDQLRERLAEVVQGKICFVGYTATAVADMINTPAYARVPGVLVHTSVLNSFLENEFRSWSPLWIQLLVIASMGAFASVLTATRGPKNAALLVIVLCAGAFLLNGFAFFERLDTWLRLFTALALMLVIWAVVVLVRFLITDRQRRQFSRAVSQYVSPAMARRIADSAQELDLSPVSGIVSCFFSDLAGFTQVSERLGPEGTREVLNPYLDAMSTVLHEHNALINKFMGDGIFAFFNPPILPCGEHQKAACEAALECVVALDELARRQQGHPLAHEFARLGMRIGITSGPVFVGDYGSVNKLDYTCVGDTVNLASRLEGANKFFGTRIMVAGSTRDAVGDAFVFRWLGRLQVKGQTVAVPVYELLARPGELNAETIAYVTLFEEAVGLFARREWEAARERFLKCLEMRKGEPAALRYIDVLDAYRDDPPPADWNMGIELTEK